MSKYINQLPHEIQTAIAHDAIAILEKNTDYSVHEHTRRYKKMMHKIFVNYGDKNFLEYGVAIEAYINDQLAIVDTEEEIRILYCRPFDDDDAYMFADCTVNINDTWIDKKAVMEFSGLDKISTVNERIQLAIACIEYYGVDNFSSPYDGYKHDCDYIKEYFRYHVINESDFTLDDVFQ